MTPRETGSCDQRPVAPSGSFRKTLPACLSLLFPDQAWHEEAQFVGKTRPVAELQ